jgi:hypothetical protein
MTPVRDGRSARTGRSLHGMTGSARLMCDDAGRGRGSTHRLNVARVAAAFSAWYARLNEERPQDPQDRAWPTALRQNTTKYLWGARTVPIVVTWAFRRPARIR